ncbi:nuclear transport factor 2 family protein [Streptomyces sp. 4N509B]|uniref:nuclear transport factor 2 family protein n=1 Tax=Streptomyces sp. 4N509B TaxID=3457413 RepID=UPI003FD0CFCC
MESPGRARDEVLELVGRWADAERRNDADALDALLTPDFLGVGPAGFVLDHDQWLERYRGGDLRNSAFELTEPTVRTFGDSAVVVGVQEQQTSYRGHEAGGRFRTTLVAARPNGSWQVAGWHCSPIAGPPPGG